MDKLGKGGSEMGPRQDAGSCWHRRGVQQSPASTARAGRGLGTTLGPLKTLYGLVWSPTCPISVPGETGGSGCRAPTGVRVPVLGERGGVLQGRMQKRMEGEMGKKK